MLKVNVVPEFYVVTYHDTEQNGACFDEDRFYDIETLKTHLQHISEGCKVWAAFHYDENMIFVELCNIV